MENRIGCYDPCRTCSRTLSRCQDKPSLTCGLRTPASYGHLRAADTCGLRTRATHRCGRPDHFRIAKTAAPIKMSVMRASDERRFCFNVSINLFCVSMTESFAAIVSSFAATVFRSESVSFVRVAFSSVKSTFVRFSVESRSERALFSMTRESMSARAAFNSSTAAEQAFTSSPLVLRSASAASPDPADRSLPAALLFSARVGDLGELCAEFVGGGVD